MVRNQGEEFTSGPVYFHFDGMGTRFRFPQLSYLSAEEVSLVLSNFQVRLPREQILVGLAAFTQVVVPVFGEARVRLG